MKKNKNKRTGFKKSNIGLHDIVPYATREMLQDWSSWNFMPGYIKFHGKIFSVKEKPLC